MSRGVIAVVAHPDDESLIAGGTLALAARVGVRTGVVSLTQGELGPIADPAKARRETLGDVRAGELRDAGVALGVAWTRCLRHADGELTWDESVEGELTELLEREKPGVVLTFGADGLYEHPDHVATGRAARAAGERVGTSIYEAAWDAQLVPALVAAARHRGLPVDLWGLEPEAFGVPDPRPTVTVDVSAVLSAKLEAIRAHRTQLDDGHLLARLPEDLALRFLASEPWRLANGAPPGPLPSLLHG